MRQQSAYCWRTRFLERAATVGCAFFSVLISAYFHTERQGERERHRDILILLLQQGTVPRGRGSRAVLFPSLLSLPSSLSLCRFCNMELVRQTFGISKQFLALLLACYMTFKGLSKIDFKILKHKMLQN